MSLSNQTFILTFVAERKALCRSAMAGGGRFKYVHGILKIRRIFAGDLKRG